MGQSLDFSKIPPLSEAEIGQNSYKLHQLWMIHHKKKIYGPYHVDKMREIAEANQKELEPSSACNLSRGRWFYFFDNTEFQSRNDQEYYKPVVIANEIIKVYANEKEHGPYEFPELVHLLKERKFRYVDLFSIDNGETWRKIYEIDGLDRRAIDENQLKLPDIPDMKAYTSEQLKFIKKTPNNHNVVLELKKIDPQPNQQKTRKEKASSAHSRRVRAEVRKSTKPKEKSSSLTGLVIVFIVIIAIWAFFKNDIKGLLGSGKKAKFSQNDFQQRNYKRKVSKFNLGLQPAEREKPRIRKAPEVDMSDVAEVEPDEPEEMEANDESDTQLASRRPVRQKSFDAANVNNYDVQDNNDNYDQAAYDNYDEPLSDQLRGVTTNTAADIAIGSDEGFYDREDSFFPQTEVREPVDGEYFAEDEGYSELPSNDFLQNDADYTYPEDDY